MTKKKQATVEPTAEAIVEEINEQTTEATETIAIDEAVDVQQELEKALQEKEDMYQRMLRVQADFDNFRRRTRQEQEQFSMYASEDVLKKILPVLDNLERTVAACAQDKAEKNSLQSGVELVLKQFCAVLESEGLKAIDALNKPFDPNFHEAVMQETSSDVEVDTVIMELQKGYMYKEKLLRPATVKVATPA